jgi:hypothetical protein
MKKAQATDLTKKAIAKEYKKIKTMASGDILFMPTTFNPEAFFN